MRIETVTPQAVRLRISRSELCGRRTLTDEQARLAVSEALEESGEPPWEQMEVTVFPGIGEVLVIARRVRQEPLRFRFRRFSELAAALDYLPAQARADIYALPDGFELLLRCAGQPPNAFFEFGEALPCPPEIAAHLTEQGERIAEDVDAAFLRRPFAEQ